MNLLTTIYVSIAVTLCLFMVIGLLLNMTRNFFTRSRYVKVVIFNDDKTATVKHYKKKNFNEDNGFILNPNHIFLLKGYTTLIFTKHSKENINPLDFNSKYDAVMYETAIKSKVIQETFASLKSGKLDMIKIAVIASVMTLALVLYLILKQNGVM